jgi:hypothetical protein
MRHRLPFPGIFLLALSLTWGPLPAPAAGGNVRVLIFQEIIGGSQSELYPGLSEPISKFLARKLNAIPGVEAVIEARPTQRTLAEVEETGFRRYLEIAKRKKGDFLLFTEIFFIYETFDHEDIITALLLDGSTKKFLKSEMADVELVSADQFLDFPYRDILKTFYTRFSRKIMPGLRAAVARRGGPPAPPAKAVAKAPAPPEAAPQRAGDKPPAAMAGLEAEQERIAAAPGKSPEQDASARAASDPGDGRTKILYTGMLGSGCGKRPNKRFTESARKKLGRNPKFDLLGEDRLHRATGGNEYSIEDYSEDDFRLARRIGKKAGAEFVYLSQREPAGNFRGCITTYTIVVVDEPGAFFKAEAVWTPEMSKFERLQVYKKARQVLFGKAWPALRRARARKARRGLVREAKKEAPLPRVPAGPDPDMLARLQRLEKEISRLRSQKGSAPAPGGARSARVETPWRSAGTGFYLKGTRHIMTNLHVVGSATQIRISFPQGGTYTGMVIARDANNDVAIVRLQGMSPSKA